MSASKLRIFFIKLALSRTICFAFIFLSSAFATGSDFIWPFDYFKVTQEFGVTKDSDNYASGSHWGIDISMGENAHVHPIAEGIILAIGSENCPNQPNESCNFGHGNWILIDHLHLNTQSFYGHLSEKPTLKIGEYVSKASVIGREGRSGRVFHIGSKELADATCETHLHLSIGEIKAYKAKHFANHYDIQVGDLKNPRDVLPYIPTAHFYD